jgi:hypothetical protein
MSSYRSHSYVPCIPVTGLVAADQQDRLAQRIEREEHSLNGVERRLIAAVYFAPYEA